MALEQHAIPTQVTAYEFRLIGDMTLKQFAWLGGGIILALIAYSLPLPSYVRWPMVLMLGPSGALVAFVPIEGRSIDRWIVAFAKAIYSPTEFIWRQEHPVPEFFKRTTKITSTAPAKVAQSDQQQLEEYIESLPGSQHLTKLDQKENKQLQKIEQMFSNTNLPTNNNLTDSSTATPTSSIPPSTPVPSEEAINNPADTEPSANMPDLQKFQPAQPDQINMDSLEKQVAQTLDINSTDLQASSTDKDNQSSNSSPSSQSQPPSTEEQKIDQADTQLQQTMAQSPGTSDSDNQSSTPGVAPTYSQQSPVPTPSQPNIIAGMVIDQPGKIVDNAIVEIKDPNNKPVRALKTNKLGQFTIATPLRNGSYTVIVEKEGLTFDNISIKAEGKIIHPITIQAR